MKICLTNSFYYPEIVGGAEVSVLKLAQQLKKDGNDVHVLCNGKKDECINIDGVNVHRIKVINICNTIDIMNTKNKVMKFIYLVFDMFNIFNYIKIYKQIKKINPDVIHSNNVLGIRSIWKVSQKLNIPMIQTMRDYSLMDANNVIIRNLKRVIYRNKSKNINIVTAPSQYTLDRFVNCGYFKNSEKKAIFNAIDLDGKECEEILEFKRKKLISKNSIKFVYIGRLEKEKGIEFLINEFKHIKNDKINLLIMGKGSYQDEVINSAKNDKRIKYLGFLKESEINEVLKDSDVLIIPSIWPEPFGRVVIEAYKFSMPVIGSCVGGIPEIIEDGISGKLIEAQNSYDLREAINYFSNKENIIKMMDKCCKKANEFDIKNQSKRFTELYNKAIE